MNHTHPKYLAALVCLTSLVLGLCNSSQAQDNMFRVRSRTLLQFETNESFKVGPDSTIEFSFRPMADFEPNGSSDFQCLAYCGTVQDLAFAILLRTDFDSGEAQIGLVSSFEDVGADENYISLTKYDSFNEVVPIRFERGKTYHASLVITKENSTVDVYLDGHPQGSLACGVSAGKSQNAVLTVGGKPDGVENAFSFEGELGGLRFWNRALPEPSVIALQKFGRNCDPQELTHIYEYGFLLAYGDFRGTTPARCKLVFPNRLLGGVWRNQFATVETLSDQATFLDYPVYTFLPESNRSFQVYEDTNYVGQLLPVGSDETGWSFRHNDDGWQPVDFQLKEIKKAGRVSTQLVCQNLPQIPRPFAGKKSGSLTLVRGTLDADGAGLDLSRFFSKAEKNQHKQNDDMTNVFLLGNNVRYRDVLYGGYNMPKMDKFNLFINGVNRSDNYLFARPESGLFAIDSNQIRILPVDLQISNRNMGQTSSQSYYVSNAMEYSKLVTSRLGAGVNGSVAVTAGGGAIPASVQATVNMSVVLQSEDSREQVTMNSANQDKMISISSYQHYDLHHKKDMSRLDPKFRKALLRLYEECQGQNQFSRQQTINQFFDLWGTHFVFGGTFGALKWSERTIDETTVQNINRQSWDQFVSVNDGRSGSQGTLSSSVTNSLKAISEKTRSVGGKSAGTADSPAGPDDEPAPINLDLRSIAQLCSPQFFPDNFEIFTDLRDWINIAYTQYLRQTVIDQLGRKNSDVEFKRKAQECLETGDWESLETKLYQVQIKSSTFEILDTDSGSPLNPSLLDKIKSVDLSINLESGNDESGNRMTSQYEFISKDKPDRFSKSSTMFAHFIPFEPGGENEIVKVTVQGAIYHKLDGLVSPSDVASHRPTDCEFFLTTDARPVATTSEILMSWNERLVAEGVFFQINEKKRQRHFYFSQSDDGNEVQEITHTLGPFSGEELPSCFLHAKTKYCLARVPSTSSIWANLNASSRSAIKSDDPKFGNFVTPTVVPIDFYKNRSTMTSSQPTAPPVGNLATRGSTK